MSKRTAGAKATSSDRPQAESATRARSAYFDLEPSLREVGHMIGIATTFAYDLLSDAAKNLDDGTVTIRMTSREQDQLLFSISKVRDLFEVLRKTYDSGFGQREPEEGTQ
jgi:hypothetical protein